MNKESPGQTLITLAFYLAVLGFLGGCASYGSIQNLHKSQSDNLVNYSLKKVVDDGRSGEATFVLAFSGGGTRAAALAFGVLQELRDTWVQVDGKSHRLLDEVDLISSVSGGSFTAAYLGLFGDRIFSDFEKEFLLQDVEGQLFSAILSPSFWFSDRGRTELAVHHYETHIFKGSTFADMYQRDGPLIMINASDLSGGVRFTFIQDYFDLLCSDLSSFPVARAVTASSAVPVLFNPVVLKNHEGCEVTIEAVIDSEEQNSKSLNLKDTIKGLKSFSDKQQRQYIHLVDGGITDNLGLLAIYEMVELAGGARSFISRLHAEVAPRLVVLSVNASTKPQYEMDTTNKVASIEETVNAMSDVQLHRSNAATLELFEKSLNQWAIDLSVDGKVVEPFFIDVDFSQLDNSQLGQFINEIPTSFSLQPEQVKALISSGRTLLRDNPEFQRFVESINRVKFNNR